MKKRVVVFGIFDGVHDGHRDLFHQAKEYGDELTVIVGRDSAAMTWKQKKPRFSEQERMTLLRKEPYVASAILGDEEQSTYEVLEELKPDVICVGYDQEDLHTDLLSWMEKKGWDTKIIRLEPYKPEIFHNSKL